MAKQTFTTGQVLTAAQMTSLQQTAMLGGSASAKTASYTLVAADAGTAITMSNASATTITVNTGLFAAGDTVTILNIGAGVCTVTAGTATVSKATNATLALVQNAGGVLYFTATGAATFMPFDVGSGASSFVGCSVYKSASQNINNATYTAVTFDTELYDTDNIHSNSTNTSRFTVPTGKAGKWCLVIIVGYGTASGIRAGGFYKNGSVQQYSTQVPASNSLSDFVTNVYVMDCAAGDYVEFYGYQNSGSTGSILGTQLNTAAQFYYLGA